MTFNTKNPNQTESFFHEYAVDFDSIYGNENKAFSGFINRLFRKSMRLRFELTLQACSPVDNRTVLDVGCGPGHYSIALARQGAVVTGIDFAPGMIELARAKSKAENLEDKIRFVTGDFLKLDDSLRFDYLIFMGFMDYMEDARLVVQKALGMTQKACFFSFPASEGLLAWQRKLRYRTRCPLYLYDKEQIIKLFNPYTCFRTQIKRIDRDYWVVSEPKTNYVH